jgi:hypothetical protein
LDENILIKKFSKNRGEIVLGAIYGPNTTNRTFYNNLTRYLTNNNNGPVVLAGDWNTTWDGSPPRNYSIRKKNCATIKFHYSSFQVYSGAINCHLSVFLEFIASLGACLSWGIFLMCDPGHQSRQVTIQILSKIVIFRILRN